MNLEDQPFFQEKLWEEFAVRCEFPPRDLLRVWDYVCGIKEPQCAKNALQNLQMWKSHT